MTRAWTVYLARCADGTLYCGMTTNLERRLLQHNGQLPGGAKYTANRRPVVIEHFRDGLDRSAAAKLENQIKALPKARKIQYLLD